MIPFLGWSGKIRKVFCLIIKPANAFMFPSSTPIFQVNITFNDKFAKHCYDYFMIFMYIMKTAQQ
jgi:hypothetical protein